MTDDNIGLSNSWDQVHIAKAETLEFESLQLPVRQTKNYSMTYAIIQTGGN